MLVRSLLGGVLVLVVAIGIGRFAYTPVLPAMQRGAYLATGAAGLLASANYLGYLAGALLAVLVPRGVVRDRVLGGSLVVVALTTGLMASTGQLVAWGILRVLCGLASAGAFVLASDLVLERLRRQRAAELAGWLYSGVGLGIAASGVVVRVVDTAHGWRGDWLALALLAGVLTVAAWVLLPRADTASSGTAKLTSQPVGGNRPRALGVLLGAYLLEGAGYVVTGTFLVAIVDGTTGLGGRGADAWILVGLAAAPSCIAWAWLAARVGYAPALVLAYVGQASSIALPVLAGGAVVVMAAAALFGATAVGIVTLTLTFAGQVSPRGGLGSVAFLTAAFGLGQIVGPVLGGLVAERTGSFDRALEVAAAAVFLGGLLMLALLVGSAPPSATATTKGACCS